MKWFKRILALLLVVAVGAAALLATSYYLIRRTPSWYRPQAMNSQEMEAAANRAFNKVAAIHNMADESAALESSSQWSRDHGQSPASRPSVQPITVTFTQDELTAFILRWSTLNSDRVETYISGPQFALRDGQIIFGGQISELGQFGALHVEPSLDDAGLLHLDIAEIRAGQLRVPRSLVESRLTKVRATLQQWLPEWQRTAKIDAGGANNEAVKAAMTELLLNTLGEKPSQPFFFMPIGDRKTVPVKLTHVKIADGSITLTVEPLRGADRKTALDSIREPYGTPTAQNQ